MLIPNHPDEERLAALASHETDATADAALTSHVAACHRCTTVIDELGALRAALADLPDLAPSRPLQLVPAVDSVPAPAAGGFAGWARRFFAPVLASGAALALVGMIGTAGPSLSGQAARPEAGGAVAESEAAAVEQAPAPAVASEPAGGDSAGAAEFGASDEQPTAASEHAITLQDGEYESLESAPAEESRQFGGDSSERRDDSGALRLSAGPSPWLYVLIAGVALMIAALLVRYVVVPRAG
jgi:hypothetical protein